MKRSMMMLISAPSGVTVTASDRSAIDQRQQHARHLRCEKPLGLQREQPRGLGNQPQRHLLRGGDAPVVG